MEFFNKLNDRLVQIKNASKFTIKDLTEGEIKSIFEEHRLPIEVIFLTIIYIEDINLFKHGPRIGEELRALTSNKLSFIQTYNDKRLFSPNITSIREEEIILIIT